MNPSETRDRGDGWDTVCLEAVGSILTGHPFKSDAFTNNPTEGDLPLVRIRDVLAGHSFTYVAGSIDHETRSRYLVKDGDVLIGMDGQFHVSEWRGGEALLNQRVAKVAFDDAVVNPVFGYYSLLAPIRLIEAGKHYTTVKHLSMSDLRSLEIPLPSLLEQRAIAHVLRTVQRAKVATEQVITAARDTRNSLVLHLLDGSWPSKPLGQVSQIGNGSTPKRSRADYWAGGTVPWITSRKVHEGVIDHADDHVTEVAVGECHLPLVPAGSVVVAISGQGRTLGNAALVTFGTTVNQHLAYVRPNVQELDSRYLVAYLSSRYKDLQAAGQAGGSTRAALTCAYLKSYPIPIPPLERQQAIAESVGALDRKIAAEEACRDALTTLFASLLHDLMAARLRVPDLEISA